MGLGSQEIIFEFQNSERDTAQLIAESKKSNPEAQYSLSLMYFNGNNGMKKSFDNAMRWLKKSSDGNYPEAVFLLSNLYLEGEDVEKNVDQGISLMKKASDLGYLEAVYKMAWIYRYGINTNQDIEQAMELYKRAAVRGHMASQYELAVLYSVGLGVEVDESESIRWFTESANQGFLDSLRYLGYAYSTGIDDVIDRDFNQSMEYWKLASDFGDDESTYNLGICYAKLAIKSWKSINSEDYGGNAGLLVKDAISIGWDE